MPNEYCPECGTRLIRKPLENEGVVPYCPSCGQYRFPMYNVAVSMIVIRRDTDQILLIKQYGRDAYILVAGYVNRTESLEHAVRREIKEETGMRVSEIRFNRTKFFEPSNTLMCNFTAFAEDASELNPNQEIDSCRWFSFAEAKENIKPGSLAAEFLNKYLEDAGFAEN